MSNLLTIHTLVAIPWSNLNRDDTGTPKRLIQGGVMRGQLSSQSIKRAARVAYEKASQDISVRSGNLAELVAERVCEINSDISSKEALKQAKKAVGALTKAEKGSADSAEGAGDESSRSTWLSGEELEACAQSIAAGASDSDFVKAGETGSLAIAAFGRMFAAAPGKKTEAAIAVSPAVSTHGAIIETDYFSTVDDHPTEKQGAGSTFLGIAMFTTGCFYRTVTIDKKQLRESWTGMDKEESRDNLKAMIDALIYALPRGKKNSTAPYVMPALLLAEEQAHRIAYDFETPVQADGETGGYIEGSVAELLKQYKQARLFDPENFAGLEAISGTSENLEGFEVPWSNKAEFIEKIVNWILQ